MGRKYVIASRAVPSLSAAVAVIGLLVGGMFIDPVRNVPRCQQDRAIPASLELEHLHPGGMNDNKSGPYSLDHETQKLS
jgi:hypothetical protein